MWGVLFGITFIVMCIILYDWPKIEKKQKKEKIAFIALISLGWSLAVLLTFQPELPGPTKLVDAVFKPMGKLLE